MPGPPPTKYLPDLIKKAWEYLAILPEGQELHTNEGLAQHIGVSRSTLYAWQGVAGKEELSDILERIQQKQALSLINKGLTGEYNSTMAKLMLTKHGYSDKVDSDVNITMTPEQADQIIRDHGIDPDTL